MIQRIKVLLFVTLTTLSTFSFADEGMWFPQLLQQMNAAEMRIKGLQIPIEELYNVNKNSLKDAVVLFGGGCTGEIISKQGLLLTNHHCGFSEIQSHSTVENNYLMDGFWAKTLNEELPCPGLTATFIISINDVTTEFNKELDLQMSESQRDAKIKEIAARLEKEAVKSTHYDARVRQFFSGNEFYLIISETFKDVRMVGAPPSSIGKFGGDTDNWMWPRHTGDFSLFRVYANKDNKPAEYSADNVPFTPRMSFSISLKGVQENDFTMVYGFPGRTQEYISSYAVDMIVNTNNPNRIKVRTERLRIMDDAMRKSEKLHLQYAAKQSSVSNAWKKWKGETKGLIEANAIQKKKDLEIDFQTWADAEPKRKNLYGKLLRQFNRIYSETKPYIIANDFYSEAVYGIEIISYANGFRALVDSASVTNADPTKIKETATKLNKGTSGYFKDYDVSTDQAMMASLLNIFNNEVPDSLKPTYFTDMRNRYKGDFEKLSKDIFAKSVFVDSVKMKNLLSDFNSAALKKIKKDPAYLLTDALTKFYRSVVAIKVGGMAADLAMLNRRFLAGQREMKPEKKFYPDANSTLRIAYGQVMGYDARDAVRYNYYTTLDGLMEKYIPGNEEFDVPAKLVALYKKKDYGRYAVNGKLPIAFIATNHTTGGNSGSPVLNAKGQLIGTNYDRVWEGTMSDILFNPEVCRNVTLDIRYTLFVIEKMGEANRLIQELDLID
jgi:hypothetical protein